MTNLTPCDIEILLETLSSYSRSPRLSTWTWAPTSGPPSSTTALVDPDSELPIHRVGIDANTVRPVWWIDLNEGTRTILLEEVTPDDVCTVAARVAETQQHD